MYSMVTFSLDDMMKYQDCVPVVILHEHHWTSLHTVHLCGFWSERQILQCPLQRNLVPVLPNLLPIDPFAYCLLPITVSSLEGLVPVLPNWLPIDPLPDWWSVLTPETTILQTSLFRWIIMLLLSSITDVSVFRRFYLSIWEQYLLVCSYYGSNTGPRNKAQTVHCSWFQGSLFTRVLLLFPQYHFLIFHNMFLVEYSKALDGIATRNMLN